MTPWFQMRGRLACVFLMTFITIQAHTQTSNCLTFDGTDDYVSIPHNAALNFPNFTFEAWINLSSTSGGLTILSKGDGTDGSTTNYIFNVGAGSSNARLGLFAGGSWYSVNTSLTTGKWYHAAVTVSGTTVTFYLNGISDGIATLSGAIYTGGTYAMKIGEQGSTCSCNRMNGKLDEIRTWNTARTSTEIKLNLINRNLSNSAAGLVAYYRFNEGSLTNAANACTNTTGIDGTLTNGPVWAASPVQFATNTLHFNGSSNYIQLNNRISIGSSNFTLEAWVNPSSTAAGMIYAQDVCGDAEHQYRLYTVNTRVYFDISDALALGIPYSFQLPTPVNSVPLNTWTHVAVTRSGNTYSIYLNGVFSTSTTTGTNTINNQSGTDVNKRLRIGSRGGVAAGCGLNYFTGNIDELRVWNVARTATEIQQNYLHEMDPDANANLVSYYTFNQGVASGSNTGLNTIFDLKGNNNGTLTGFSLSGSTSNFITQNSSILLLPLKWLSFTAQKQNAGVLLQWSTASETHTAGFTVEHKTNIGDWKFLATIPSKDNGQNVHHYHHMHSAPQEGLNYYRIVQRDKDGKYTYSVIRTIHIVSHGKPFSIISNPVTTGVLKIQLYSSQVGLITLVSTDGKIIWNKKLVMGINEIPVRQLSGTYLITDGRQVEKVQLAPSH